MLKALIKRIFQAQVIRQRQLTGEYLERILGSDRLQCLDVGAACGLLEHWERIGRAGNYYHVEPHEESAAALEKQFQGESNHGVLKVALSGKGGLRVLTMTNSPTGSSILPFNEELIKANVDPGYLEPRRSIQIETLKTSEALDRNNVGRIDLMKLDVQGAELEIVQGLDDRRLNDLLCVELEVNFHNAYIGQGTFSEIQNFMNKFDLELYDIRLARGFGLLDGKPASPKIFGVYENSRSVSSRIWEADVVFFKNPKQLIKNRDIRGLKRLIASLCIYGFFLDCLKVLREMGDEKILDPKSIAGLEQVIFEMHRMTSARWFDFPNFLTRLLRKVGNYSHVGPDWYRIQYSHVSLPNG
jgi:FkbM family methyltransferase